MPKSTSPSSSIRSVLLLVVLGVAGPVGAMEHLGRIGTDDFVRCVRSVFGKPVYFHWSDVLDTLPCSTSREALVESLKAKDMSFVEGEWGVFLYPAVWSRPYAHLPPHILWKRLRIDRAVENWGGIPGTRELTDEEREQIGKVVFEEARPAPLYTPSEPGPDHETAVLKYLLRVTAYRLIASPTESVIGILGKVGGTSRLVYGELRNGKYEALWDSPLFRGFMLKLGFEDMDGDGTKEILVASVTGMKMEGMLLTIFDARGRELTRQKECEIEGRSGYMEEGGVCPLAGRQITLDDPRGGKRDLLVLGRAESLGGWDEKKTYRYRLAQGRYVSDSDPVDAEQPKMKCDWK